MFYKNMEENAEDIDYHRGERGNLYERSRMRRGRSQGGKRRL